MGSTDLAEAGVDLERVYLDTGKQTVEPFESLSCPIGARGNQWNFSLKPFFGPVAQPVSGILLPKGSSVGPLDKHESLEARHYRRVVDKMQQWASLEA